jgi:hypothetical protein
MTPDTDGTEIDEVRRFEDEVYRASQERLSESASLVQDISDLYLAIMKIYDCSGIPPKDEIICGLIQVQLCQYQLITGCLTLERGHLADSFQYARKAIESCAATSRISKHPELAAVWLQGWRPGERYRTYRKEFSPKKLFPRDDPVMCKLYERYEQCSERAHANSLAFAGRLRHEYDEDKVNIRFHYSELTTEDTSEPALTLLWTVDTHFGIATTFAGILKEVIDTDRTAWELRRNKVNAKIHAHRERWKDAIRKRSLSA